MEFEPTVKIPALPPGLEVRLKEHRHEWLKHCKAYDRNGSWDTEKKINQSIANLDHLLDHYPDCQHRDIQSLGRDLLTVQNLPEAERVLNES